MTSQGVRGLLRLWLILSLIWIGGVAFQTWRDIPRDDWVQSDVNEPNDDQYGVPVGIFDQIVRLVIGRGAKLAFIPPIIVLACGLAYICALRSFPPRK